MFAGCNMWWAVYSRSAQKDIFTVNLLHLTAGSVESSHNLSHVPDALFTVLGKRQRGSSLEGHRILSAVPVSRITWCGQRLRRCCWHRHCCYVKKHFLFRQVQIGKNQASTLGQTNCCWRRPWLAHVKATAASVRAPKPHGGLALSM